MMCEYRPLEEEKFCVQVTIRRNKLKYDDKTASPTADLLETKILLNSTILDAHEVACFMGIDIKKCFLMTNLLTDRREYMCIHSRYFQEVFCKLYKLHDKIHPRMAMYAVK